MHAADSTASGRNLNLTATLETLGNTNSLEQAGCWQMTLTNRSVERSLTIRNNTFAEVTCFAC